MGKSDFKNLLNKMDIKDVLTDAPPKKRFNKVKTSLNMTPNTNYMADLLELEPTKKGYKWLLVVVDLATDEFDLEPLMNKESRNVLDAIKAIFNRNLKKPSATLATDGGSEFKNVFHKWLDDQEIYHKVGLPYRHQQLGNVESLNSQIGRIISLMSNKVLLQRENANDNEPVDWTLFLDEIRKELNEYRYEPNPKQSIPIFDLDAKPKYKVGDWVYHLSHEPMDALGNKFQRKKFRQGDLRYDYRPSQITKVIEKPMELRKPIYDLKQTDFMKFDETFNSKTEFHKKEGKEFNEKLNAREAPRFRYLLRGKNNVSYAENELKPAQAPRGNVEKGDVLRVVEKVLQRAFDKDGNEIFKIKWMREGNQKKTLTTWEQGANMREQIPDMIEKFLDDNPNEAQKQPPAVRAVVPRRPKKQTAPRQGQEKEVAPIREERSHYGLRSAPKKNSRYFEE